MFSENLFYSAENIDGAWKHWYDILTKDAGSHTFE